MKVLRSYILLNYLSIILIGSTGILLNIILVLAYSQEVLGKFNFYLACLVISSQISVGGIQFSVLKHNAHFFKRYQEVSGIVISALLLSLIFSVVVICSLIFLVPLVEKIFNIGDFQYSIMFILPAIMFFSLNKILLMSLNGLNKMAEYAFFNALRYVLLLLAMVSFYWLNFSSSYIQVVLSVSEGFLFVVLMLYMFVKVIKLTFPKARWIKRHFSFGMRSMIGGALMEVNTRIDVLMIGAFLGYTAVGIYSFASMIAEGFAQVFIVLKNNVDPVFGSAFQAKNNKKIYETISRIRKSYISILILLGIIMVISYPIIFTKLFNLESEFVTQSWYVLAILVSFILLVSFYRPFIGLLIQINKPHQFSIIVFISVLINILLNSLLIGTIGIYGAALATGVAFIVESYFLYKFALRTLKG